MSYARLSPGSDVYVYETAGGIQCGGLCSHFTVTAAEMSAHLREHAAKGATRCQRRHWPHSTLTSAPPWPARPPTGTQTARSTSAGTAGSG